MKSILSLKFSLFMIVLLIVGCEDKSYQRNEKLVENTIVEIREWTKAKETESVFYYIHFYHPDEEREETWATMDALYVLKGMEPPERARGTINLRLFNIIDVVQKKVNPIEEMKNQDLKILWKDMKNIRDGFIIFIFYQSVPAHCNYGYFFICHIISLLFHGKRHDRLLGMQAVFGFIEHN